MSYSNCTKKVEVEKEVMTDILTKHFGSYAVTIAANIYSKIL